MRAVSLHRDVIVATSRIYATNCTIVRGPRGEAEEASNETFVVDSPILPDELELLPSIVSQAGFAEPVGLLATHVDWDHVLGPLAFPGAPLGCAESSAARLSAEPGAAQRELRAFDDELYVSRPRPLSLSSVQALPVPGRLGIGSEELELHPAEGHTADGMAIVIGWAGVLLAGDYASATEIPTLAGSVDAYLATLERLAPLVAACEHVVPGHGPPLARAEAERVLEEDAAYIVELRERGARASLPPRRRSGAQRRLHERNAAALERGVSPRS
ncbi:MAG TPA: MBL fold metallo-hydrolase [Solirubrobacteraceae bacterium]|jgi:glyoxylase-like metal-dependent hydrolase (beta-lactamase superfamily II)|nr:MBL fold metallo-hydrolase [Solirubrobacteraceae bacterium]